MLIRRFPLLEGEQGGGSGAGAAGGQGNGGAAGGAGSGSSASGNASGAGSSPWYSSYPDSLKGQIEAKGFKDAPALAESYFALEKMRGVPPERLVALPDKPDAPEWKDAYRKLGMPEKADDYDVKVPTGQSDEFAKWAKEQFHGLGLSKRQGETLAAKWNEYQAAAEGKAKEARDVRMQEGVNNLKREWGAALAQNAKIVDQFTAAMGLTDEQQQKMEEVLGFDGFSKLIHGITEKFGIKFGEHDFQTSGSGKNLFDAVLSPAGAKAKREQLLQDPEYRKRWLNNETKERAEINQLYEWEFADKT